jgi:hypothetical protein
MFLDVVQIKIHLPGIRMSENAPFQVDDHKASQGPVIEQQIDPIPCCAHADAFLSGNEGEPRSQF